MDKKIIVAGYIGLEGSLNIFKENEEELKLYFSKHFINQLKKCEMNLISTLHLDRMKLGKSPLPEEADVFVGECREENVIIPLGESPAYKSLWSALWNLCETWRKGIEVEISRIPIRQETIEICQYFNLNPYKLSSRGSYLIVTDNPMQIKTEFTELNTDSNMIGRVTDKKERLVMRGDYIRHLPRTLR